MTHSSPARRPGESRRLADAFVSLDEAIAELRGLALVTDIVSAHTMGLRGEAGSCSLTADKADALEFTVNRLSAVALDLHRSYVATSRSAA